MKDRKKLLNKRTSNIAKVGAGFFGTKGFVETSMEDIAASAKLSKGGIYHYFQSKTELLNYVLDSFMDIVLKDLNEDLDKVENGPEKLKKLISRHVELYTEHMYEAKTLINEAHNLPSKFRREIIVKEREYLRTAFGVVSDYLTLLCSVSMEKSQVTAITFSLLGMCNWIYSWYNPKGPVTAQELSEIIYQIFTRGIGKGPILKKPKK